MEPASGREWDQLSSSSSDGEQSAAYDSLSQFDRERHVAFLEMMYQLLPYQYQWQEINRIALAPFAISGLHLLGALGRVDKDAVSDWILSLHAHPRNKADLTNVLCPSILEQRQIFGSYIVLSYDGGFGLTPGSESHGGSTFFVAASLRLMGFIEDDVLSKNVSSAIMDVPLLLNWCLQGADGGFQGRANKPSDTCFAFWIGAVLRILSGYKFIDKESLRRFLLTCQSQFMFVLATVRWFQQMSWVYAGSVPLLGYAAFSLLEEPGLNPHCAELGMADFFALGI